MNPVRHACSLRGTRCQTKARRFIRKNMKGRLTHLCQTHQDERVAYVRVPRNWPAFTVCHPLYPYTDEFGSTDQVIGHSIDSGLRFSFCKLLILNIDGGEGGIRTPDTLTSMPDFESGAFNRALPPLRFVL